VGINSQSEEKINSSVTGLPLAGAHGRIYPCAIDWLSVVPVKRSRQGLEQHGLIGREISERGNVTSFS
jgi:hypothetical protein